MNYYDEEPEPEETETKEEPSLGVVFLVAVAAPILCLLFIAGLLGLVDWFRG